MKTFEKVAVHIPFVGLIFGVVYIIQRKIGWEHVTNITSIYWTSSVCQAIYISAAILITS